MTDAATTAVIVAAARTPIGRATKGSLTDERSEDLTAFAVREAMARVPQLEPQSIDDLILGVGVPGGSQGGNLARIVGVILGWDRVPGVTVSRYCASSLQAIRMAAHAIRSGEGSAFVAAGVESISSLARYNVDGIPGAHSPHFDDRGSTSSGVWHDPRDDGELPDVYIPMGQTAENLADFIGISRAEQDAWAFRSQQRAAQAIDAGFWSREITPYVTATGAVLTHDESPRPTTTIEGLAALRPVFRPEGTVTAGNSCPLNDGAAAVVVMSQERADELGIAPLARIIGTAVSALSPEIMGNGPVGAISRLLQSTGLSTTDIDEFELNEAFAAQVIANLRLLEIDPEKVNLNGGAIAVGHPYGMTGARIAGTLVNSLSTHDHVIGVEAMCVAGGQGMAMAIERLS